MIYVSPCLASNIARTIHTHIPLLRLSEEMRRFFIEHLRNHTFDLFHFEYPDDTITEASFLCSLLHTTRHCTQDRNVLSYRRYSIPTFIYGHRFQGLPR